MSLISCPGCSKQVSRRAPSCPHCGEPIAERSRPAPQSGGGPGVAGCLLVLLLLGGGAFVLFQTDIGKQLFSEGKKVADSQLILGKWKQQDGPLSLEFHSDGTLREERALNTGKGTWKILPGRKIELKIEGVIWGENEVTMRYDLSGDELVLTPDSGVGLALRYRKVK